MVHNLWDMELLLLNYGTPAIIPLPKPGHNSWRFLEQYSKLACTVAPLDLDFSEPRVPSIRSLVPKFSG
jgi:hypothetical protein